MYFKANSIAKLLTTWDSVCFFTGKDENTSILEMEVVKLTKLDLSFKHLNNLRKFVLQLIQKVRDSWEGFSF